MPNLVQFSAFFTQFPLFITNSFPLPMEVNAFATSIASCTFVSSYVTKRTYSSSSRLSWCERRVRKLW